MYLVFIVSQFLQIWVQSLCTKTTSHQLQNPLKYGLKFPITLNKQLCPLPVFRALSNSQLFLGKHITCIPSVPMSLRQEVTHFCAEITRGYSFKSSASTFLSFLFVRFLPVMNLEIYYFHFSVLSELSRPTL